ncbi:MAG: NAD-dependent epimerase/dehydratase family protein [Planctomycetes bacterium]|nr:NAD-dependent epimerase/dehydratase family protein [Planctomycetota bacterium]
MRVLITGGAGYLGSVLTRHLLAEGHEVRIVDNLLHGPQAHLAELADRPGFEFIEGDIRDEPLMWRALDGRQVVVHLAGIVGDPACARSPQAAHEINLDASVRLYSNALLRGVERFLFASTCSNYGRMADPDSSVDENSELRPVSLYARTKVEYEEFLLGNFMFEKPTLALPTCLRFATLYGLSPRMRFDLTVNEFTRDLTVDRKLVVYGEQFWRPYVHVRDAARAIVLAMTAPADKVAGRVFNVGDSNENYRKGDLVRLISAEIGGELDIERVEKNEDPRDYRVNFDRIARELGFEITMTVPEGIREVMASLVTTAI